MTRSSAALSALAAPIEGDPFAALAERLADAVGVRCALIAECLDSPPTHVRTLAFWEQDRLVERFVYALEGTPCAEVVAGTECFVPSGVTGMFPDDADLRRLEAESYLGVPLTDARGSVIGHLAVLDEKPMEEDLALRRTLRVFALAVTLHLERLQARLAAERERDFAGSVVHAIGNPLAAIIGTLQLAVEESPVGDAAARRALRLARRIRDVADATLMLCRHGHVRRSPLDPARVLAALRSELQPRAQRRGVRIELGSGSELDPVAADPELLGAALAAVTDNAIEAMPDGGTLRIEARALAGGGTAFEVRDSGCGLPKSLGARVFEPFVTTKSGGTGLGLSIARRVAEAHGGRIRAEDAGHAGARITLEIPG